MQLRIGGYERAVRQRENGVEAVQITWPLGTRTPKHNHHSRGWVWVLRGRIFEVQNGSKTLHEEGDSFLEVPNGSTHIVGNDSSSVAITFHVYKPELVMDVFEDDELDRMALESMVLR